MSGGGAGRSAGRLNLYGRNALIQGAAAELFKMWAVTVRARAAALDARIVLCLHDDVDGGALDGRGVVGHDHDLGRPGKGGRHTHHAAHLLFGDRDVAVAGAHDDVDGRDRFGSVGHGGDGLCSTDAVELVDTHQVGGGEQLVGHAAVGSRGNTQHDGAGTGDLRGDGCHEDAGRVQGAPARDVDARSSHGDLEVLDTDAVAFVGTGRNGPPAVKRLHGVTSRSQSGQQLAVDAGSRRRQLPERDPQGIDVGAVEAAGELAQGRVSARPHGGEDRSHLGDGGLAGQVRTREAGSQFGRDTAQVEDLQHGGAA